MRKAFHVGGNSSCRQHLRQHWELYSQKCKAKNIPVNHWAIPREVLKQQEAEKAQITQEKLRFDKVTGPREFTREGVVAAVGKLISTDDQVSFTMNNISKANITLSVIVIGQQCSIPELPRCNAT